MHRDILFVSLDELKKHFHENKRADLKLIVPHKLSSRLLTLIGKKDAIKSEELLPGSTWHHTPEEKPNLVCEAADFSSCNQFPPGAGPFTVSFAVKTQHAEPHCHPHHHELYFSEHSMEVRYRKEATAPWETYCFPHGGLLVFGPGVDHAVSVQGLTLIVETPALPDDKVCADTQTDTGIDTEK